MISPTGQRQDESSVSCSADSGDASDSSSDTSSNGSRAAEPTIAAADSTTSRVPMPELLHGQPYEEEDRFGSLAYHSEE